MEASEKNATSQSKRILRWVITLVLWLATIGLGLVAFIALQNVAAIGMSFVLSDIPADGQVQARGMITTARNVAAFVGGMLMLGVFVGGMEYHFRHIGHWRSRRIFAWTLGIEIGLILLNLLLVALLPVVF